MAKKSTGIHTFSTLLFWRQVAEWPGYMHFRRKQTLILLVLYENQASGWQRNSKVIGINFFTMNYYIIPVALVMALLLIFILSLVLKRPVKGFGYVFIILFLGTWVGQIWLPPVGPVHYGVAWIPFIFLSILLVFMILALSSIPARGRKGAETEGPIIVAGFFFWFFILLLLLALIVGYYRTPVIIASI